ncbi:asparagine synthase (glutamine-hydrolyzing) [Cohaesibacter celericrescens]|uniref:asparagine synthase (glutamine-hydrolyzing) n=1 Tax=Cohaesibacter celericrescens TaxID=2067669 RepID=UPI003564A1E1
MCGIFGRYSFDDRPVDQGILAAMSNSIRHRGPDADGYDQTGAMVVGNRRLSILDLTHASDQPLYSQDRKIVVVQNGEIYNYIELRDELKALGHIFHSLGDTEVLLRAYEEWGPKFVSRLNGMFAIAIADHRSNKLHLYRDRLGVKPFFLAGSRESGALWFGSEIKSILANGLHYPPNLQALAQFFALNYIPQPHTAFQGITHLPPAHIVTVSKEGIEMEPYWALSDTKQDTAMTVEDAKTELFSLLDDATRLRMRSDAAYGAFLSGGLDSSSVVGLMTRHTDKPIKTFSIGFSDPRFDETYYAELASNRFATEHISKCVEQDVTKNWPRVVWYSDQPHGDVSFMPTDLVAQLAVRDVKMVLTGDGGDELFAGYEKYLDFFPNGQTDHLATGWENDFCRQTGLLLGDEASQLLRGDLAQAFCDIDPYKELSQSIQKADHQDPINRVLIAETEVLLPGNNLVKSDRMSMANSLEVRSPFLDYRMAEFSMRVPGWMKLEGNQTKAIYKHAVHDLLGTELTYRKKRMFTVPIGEWFRETLQSYCNDVLLDGRLEARGLFNMDFVRKMLDSHVRNEHNYTRQIRSLIAIELWYRIFVDREIHDFSPS